jgi:hypothetical protein
MGRPRRIALGDANYLTLKAGTNDLFAVVHQGQRDKFEISAHTFENPERCISRLWIHPEVGGFFGKLKISFEGDRSVWEHLPAAFTGYAFGNYQLVLPNAPTDDDVQTFDWFDGSYDRGYQGILDVTPVPGGELCIVSIQRDSNPVLYDPMNHRFVRKLALAGRGGSRQFHLRASADEFWATDYDTIVKLDSATLSVKAIERLQGASPTGMGQFIGDFCFDPTESACLVARPFSGDAVALDATSMRQSHCIPFGQQPLEIGLLSNGMLIARDWKTGALLSQKLT